ncbi:MAG: hypothetical protein ACOY5H_01435 [Pseudomonadota bacterium]
MPPRGRIARTINRLEGKSTLRFIAYPAPKAPHLDGIVHIAPRSRVRIKEIAMQPGLIATPVLLGLAVARLGACAGLPFSGGSSWKEEVLLHDGGTPVVERDRPPRPP